MNLKAVPPLLYVKCKQHHGDPPSTFKENNCYLVIKVIELED